ncbi:MAG: serine hydrolase [Acidobacteriaceae bacterium]
MGSIRQTSLIAITCLFSQWGIAQKPVTRVEPLHVDQRIAAVENHLSTYYSVANEPDSSMNIYARMTALHVMGVSIAVIHHGKLEWARGYGAMKSGGSPITPDTVFGAASISKALTAMAVMRFVQDGKISLDANVNQYLKYWKLPDNQFTQQRKVTVRELLGHTSGIGTHNGWVFDPTKDAIPNSVQLLNGVPPARTPPVRVEGTPGVQFHYANGGFLVLQQVLMDISGKPFWQVMRDTVLAPLGMTNSTFQTPLPRRLLARAATCYNGSHPVDPRHFMLPDAAAGGLWTTSRDLAKFVIELQKEYAGRSHRVLNQETARELLTPGLGPNPKMPWGLGVRVGGSTKDRYFEHGGSGYWETEMIGYLNGDGVVVLSSGGGGAAKFIQEVVRSVSAVYDWPDFKAIPRNTVAVDPASLDRFVGVYGFMTITKDGDRLMAEIPKGGQIVPLLAASPTEFFLHDFPTTIKFNVNGAGDVVSADFITEIVHLTLKRGPLKP